MRQFTREEAKRYQEHVRGLASKVTSGDLEVVHTVTVRQRGLLADGLRAVLSYVENLGHAADVAFMNGPTYVDFRKYTRDHLEVEAGVFLGGPESEFDNLPFFRSKAVPVGKVWILTKESSDTVYEMVVDMVS